MKRQVAATLRGEHHIASIVDLTVAVIVISFPLKMMGVYRIDVDKHG
jgi:hypothetical protein